MEYQTLGRTGVTVSSFCSQLALAWCVQQPGVTSPIIGPRTMKQLEDNLGALDGGDRATIDQLVPPGTIGSPFDEADVGPHPHRL